MTWTKKVSIYCLSESSGQPHVTPDMNSQWCQIIFIRIKTFIWFAPVNLKQIILPTAEKQDQNCPKLSNLLINHSEKKCLSSPEATGNKQWILFFFLSSSHSLQLQQNCNKTSCRWKKKQGRAQQMPYWALSWHLDVCRQECKQWIELSDVHPGAQSPLIPVIRQEHSVAFLHELKEEAFVTPDGNTDKCF